MRRKRIKPGQLVNVRLTPEERDLILERTLIDDEMEGRLRDARHPLGHNHPSVRTRRGQCVRVPISI